MQATADRGLPGIDITTRQLPLKRLAKLLASLTAIAMVASLAGWVTQDSSTPYRMSEIKPGENFHSFMGRLLFVEPLSPGSRCDKEVWAKAIERRNPHLKLDANGNATATQPVRIGLCPPVAPQPHQPH
jgi:hypothetical protein